MMMHPMNPFSSHFDTLPAFINRVSARLEEVKPCIVKTDPIVQFCFRDNQSIVYSTHPHHANIRPSYIDWTYKEQYMTDDMIDTELMIQYQAYASVVPKCIQYRVSVPMVVYKKVNYSYPVEYAHARYRHTTSTVIELEIPVGAVVNEAILGPDKGKCRSNVAITRYSRPISSSSMITSLVDPSYVYPLVSGVMITPELPFNMSLDACTSGIHFFKTYEEALNYQ